jgi:flagellin
MAAVLGTNVASMFNVQALSKSKMNLDTALARLGTGHRINSARDDATGLTNSMTYEAKMRGSQAAQLAANNGVAKAQTNDSYLQQVTENLQRLRELAVQSGGTASGAEATALSAENTRIAALVQATGAVVVGASGSTVTGVGVAYTASTALDVAGIDTALTALSTARAQFGADMVTFQSAANNNGDAAVAWAAQYSAVMDTDYAVETANMTKNNILQQAGTAALAQANQAPQNITSLLR